MAKRIYAVVAIVLVILIVLLALNGDQLYAALIRMHGGPSHH